MTEILCFLPTYAPNDEASREFPRPYTRLGLPEIADRLNTLGHNSRTKPWVYMDVIDSILAVRPDIDLVVADGRSTDSLRNELAKHQLACEGYHLALYPERTSQWKLFNDVVARHGTPDTRFVAYSSSDIVWTHDWVGEAVKEFEKDPSLMIVFPRVSSGDGDWLPCQVAPGPEDLDLIDPPYQDAARAPVLNAYAMIFRKEFLDAYGGYPTIFRNCFTESFLYYMCEAIGGKMRVMPRGWCFHHNGLDAWTGEGGYYHYTAEKAKFDAIMDEVQEVRATTKMMKTTFQRILYE